MSNLVLEIKNIEKQKPKFPDCWVCKDQGIVYYDAKINGILYEFGTRCKCKYGQKASYKVPTIRDDFAEQIAEANFKFFKEVYPELVLDLVK